VTGWWFSSSTPISNPSLAITLEKGIGVSTQIIIYTGRFDNKFFICGVVGLAYGV
jgi:hypothetical protein